METKLCSKCSQEKPTTDFYSRGAKGNHRPQAYCKACFNKFCCERWKARKVKAIETMGNRCSNCLQSYHPYLYDFHHLYGKDYDWSKLRLRSEKTIVAELAKCVLLCSNCHRLAHITGWEK